MTSINRRGALTGTAAVLGSGGLVACGDQSRSTPIGPSADREGGPIATTGDVPVGGCHVITDAKVVVTQPEEGTYKCFSAVCTHQGCLVSEGSDGVIPCHCHGSQFSLEDGSVMQGPATTGLEEYPVEVDGDSIVLS